MLLLVREKDEITLHKEIFEHFQEIYEMARAGTYLQKIIHKTVVINDPLCQTHSLASSEHCFRLKFVVSC